VVALAFIPNALTASRLVLAVAFPWLPPEWRVAAIAIAAVSDFLDGWLARRLQAESTFGRMLDPIADKLFVLVLLGVLIAEHALSPWWALAVAVRDLVVLAGVTAVAVRGRWADYRKMKPLWLGKVATTAQFVLLLVLVARGGAWLWLLLLTAALSLAAAVDYTRAFLRARPA
jgi:CDP-diacylglycerol--glycerol-3-phosphate 3-phosphatidyltransferase